MVVFTIFYPYAKGKGIDMDYYLKTHLFNAKKILGKACLKSEVTKGFKEFYPNSTPFFYATARLYFESEEAFFAAYTEDVDNFLMDDIPNFTDITPIWQLDTVVGEEDHKNV